MISQRLFQLDEEKLQKFLEYTQRIAEASGVRIEVNPFDFLRSEFSLEMDENSYEELGELILEVADSALMDLEISRLEDP